MFFTGKYNFLKNEYEMPMEMVINGVNRKFSCASSAYLAIKYPGRAAELENLKWWDAKVLSDDFKDSELAKDFKPLSAKEKKEMSEGAQELELKRRAQARIDAMEQVLRVKFSSPFLKDKLSEVPGERIVCEVSYIDTFWSVAHISPEDFRKKYPKLKPENNPDGRGYNHLGRLLTKIRNEIWAERGIGSEYLCKNTGAVPYKVQYGGVVSFDTETTGLAEYDEIIQISIVGQHGEVLLDTYVKPEGCLYWNVAEATNHISPAKVNAEGRDAKAVALAVKDIFDHADLVCAHNAPFDIRMIKKEFGYDFEAKKDSWLREKLRDNKDHADFWNSQIEKIVNLVIYPACRYASEGLSKNKIEKALIENAKVQPFDNHEREFCTEESEDIGVEKWVRFYLKKLEKYFSNIKDENGKKTPQFLQDLKTIYKEENAPEIMEDIACEIARFVYILDTREFATHFLDKVEAGSVESSDKDKLNDNQLESLVKHFLPDKLSDFKSGAHNALVDTRYLAMVVQKILPSCIGKFPILLSELTSVPAIVNLFKQSEDGKNLCGISKGIVMNLTPTDESKMSNFSKRIFKAYPQVEQKYRGLINSKSPEELEGKINMTNPDECDIRFANVFISGKKDSKDFITDAIARMSQVEKYSDYTLYLPVVTFREGDSFVIKDGIGKGPSDSTYEDMYNKIIALEDKSKGILGRIALLDSQSGKVFTYDYGIGDFVDKEEDVFVPARPQTEDLDIEGIEIC